MVNFVPSKAVGLEVAKGILDASQETWLVRTLNLGKRDVCVESGTTMGHIEIQDKGCSISAIRVPEKIHRQTRRRSATKPKRRED